MNEQIIFKTALGGFDKKAVLDYIYELDRGAAAAQDELKKELAASRSESDSLKKELESAGERIIFLENAIENSYNEQQSKEEEMRAELSCMDEEIARLKKQLEQKELELSMQIEHSKQLTKKLEDAQEKNQRYEKASIDVGMSILEARQTAKQIVEDANRKADDIVKDAVSYMGDIDSVISSLRSEKEILSQAADLSFASVRAALTRLSSAIEGACSNLSVLSPPAAKSCRDGEKALVSAASSDGIRSQERFSPRADKSVKGSIPDETDSNFFRFSAED